jgi:glutamate dehydrogenase/leucine dehydrogenase
MTADHLGAPIATLTFHEPVTGVAAFLAIDSLPDGGPTTGGVRMAPTVTLAEITRLARAMTYKYGITGVPNGGAKLGIVADPADARKPEILSRIAQLIAPLVRADLYRFGEDMGTTREDVALMYRELAIDPIGSMQQRAKRFGKQLTFPPGTTMATIGGPDFEETITGYGLVQVFEEACDVIGLDARTARVAIQGFGTVGAGLAKLLDERKVRVTTVADALGTLEADDRLPIPALLAARSRLGTIDRAKIPSGIRQRPREAWLDSPAEVVVPAAVSDVITEANVDTVRARLVLEGANIPVTESAEAMLHARGVTVVPDFVANAGAAAGYAMIWYGPATRDTLYDAVGRRLRTVTREILETSRRDGALPREAAKLVAVASLERLNVAFNRADGQGRVASA